MERTLAPQDYFEMIWAAFVSFTVLIGFFVTYHRRNLHPLKQRSLILISATPIITIVTGLAICLRSMNQLPCYVTRFGIYLIIVTFVITWLTTTYRTYFKWRIEQGKLTANTDYGHKAIGTFVGELGASDAAIDDSDS
jgi:hypothetical protein